MIHRLLTFAVPLVMFGLLTGLACGGRTEAVSSGASDDEVQIDVYGIPVHRGNATASIEERVFIADVVVKARFLRAGDDVLRFQTLEYKKGTGPGRFTVRAETEGRDTQWDNQDAILFLSVLTGESEDFGFVDSTVFDVTDIRENYPSSYTGDLPEGYTLGTRNPVWLPVGGSSSSSWPSSRSASSGEGTILSEYGLIEGESKFITESKLGETISWLDGPSIQSSRGLGFSKSSSGNSETADSRRYDDCIAYSLYIIRIARDYEAYYGIPITKSRVSEYQIESGTGKGTYKFLDWESRRDASDGPNQYARYIIFGRDAALFKSRIHDDDDFSRNGYDVDVIARRPLPEGEYRFKFTTHSFVTQACDFKSDRFLIFDVEAIAPAGSVHEAFFDPATTTAGVGYLATTSTSTGVLEPAAFSVGGRAIAITGLTWQNGRVVLTLDRFGSWLDGFSFIEPDGTFGLVLSGSEATADRAAGTLTWAVPERPWTAGDQLMLRIAPTPLPPVGNLTAEVNSDGLVVLTWEVPYTAGVSGYRIWRHRPGSDDAPRVYVSNTLSTDTTYTDHNTLPGSLTVYSVEAIDAYNNAGERSDSVRVGSQ